MQGPTRRSRISKEEKKKLKCSHCHEMGHEAEDCFKLHGVPEWYKKYRESRGQSRAHFVDTGIPPRIKSRRILLQT